jgi:hypothetical protein
MRSTSIRHDSGLYRFARKFWPFKKPIWVLAPPGDLIRLFHPRLQLWSDHFRLEGAVIQPLTEEGGATVRLLRLNHFERVVERRLLQQLGRYRRDE